VGGGGGGVDSPGSGEGPVAGGCECGDEPSGSGATGLYCRSGEQTNNAYRMFIRTPV
jgi:hypothetical protein